MLALLLAPLLAGCAADGCEGADLYVVAGDVVAGDAFVPGADAAIRGSISEALAMASPGTSICVGPGTWREELRIEQDDVSLVGAGPSLTRLLPADPGEDARSGDETLVNVLGEGVRVQGFTIGGAARGIVVASGASLELRRVHLEENGTGLLARGARRVSFRGGALTRNIHLGAWIEASDPIDLSELSVEGNGELLRSEVGGLLLQGSARLRDLELRDDAGSRAADILVDGALDARRVFVGRPLEPGGPSRIEIDGSATIDRALVEVRGTGAIHAACGGGELRLSNLAVVEVQSPIVPDHLLAEDCTLVLRHATFANLAGGAGGSAIALSGAGSAELTNSALLGYELPVASERLDGTLVQEAIFTGSPADAELLRPLPTATDLRLQDDSPLLDAGVPLALDHDIDGLPRPSGAAPDLGAYEHP